MMVLPQPTPLTIDQLIRSRAATIIETPLVAYPIAGLQYKSYSQPVGCLFCPC